MKECYGPGERSSPETSTKLTIEIAIRVDVLLKYNGIREM